MLGGEWGWGLVQQNTAPLTTLIKINDLQLAAHLQLDNRDVLIGRVNE